MIIIRPNRKLKIKSNQLKQYEQETDYTIGLDTIVMRTKLTDEQKQFIYDRFYYSFHRSKHYRYALYINTIGFVLQLSPLEPKKHAYFNASIALNPKFFKQDYIPHSIIDVLTTIDWKVTRMDIAFDYKAPKQDSLLFKHNGKMKDNNFKDSYYVGAYSKDRKNHRIVNYDRNLKEESRNNEITHKFSNRLETRFNFTMKEMPLNDLKHAVILNELSRYLFISSIDHTQFDGWTKNRLRKLQNNYEQYKAQKAKEQRKLRKMIKQSREPLEAIYEANMDNLFDFMTYKESYSIEAESA